MFEVKRYTPDMKDEWNEFIAHSKQGTFLLDRNYMDYHHDRFTDFSLVIYHKSHIYALLPANINGDTLWSHQGLTYGGLITDKEATSEDICEVFKDINGYLRSSGIKTVNYKAIPWIYHQIPADEDLYAIFNVCHGRLMLRNIASVVIQNNRIKWRRDRHYGANKAHTNGIIVEQDDNAYDAFWKVLDENLMMTYNAKPVHTIDEIKKLHSSFPDNIKLYVAKLDGDVLGGCLFYKTPQVVHCQYISASPFGKHLHAIDAIIRKAMGEDFSDFKYFDFGTSNEDSGKKINDSLIYQKEGFGGRGVCYDWYTWNI